MVGACPAQNARATWTGGVCAWRAGEAGEGDADRKEGPRVTVARGLKRGGDVVSVGGGEVKGLGTVEAEGEGVRLSAKRVAVGPVDL
jgi:hypothetical protein